jgi:hypothetical protein
MIWLWISTVVVLLGAELNAEIEHQTARGSTIGAEKPLGVVWSWPILSQRSNRKIGRAISQEDHSFSGKSSNKGVDGWRIDRVKTSRVDAGKCCGVTHTCPQRTG